NPGSDPVAVTEYLLSFEPPLLDFLLPLVNHDTRPTHPGSDYPPAPYGDWLVRSYDYAKSRCCSTRIRLFDSIRAVVCGRVSPSESSGAGPASFVVVRPNGDIELLDALKSAYEGATKSGLNVFDHDLEAAACHPEILKRHSGKASLSGTCQ